jgi:Fic family protein
MVEPDFDTTAKYIYHSNRLDGLAVTEEDTRALLQGATPESVTGDDGKTYEPEVVRGHERAFKRTLHLAKESAPLSTDDINSIHKALMGEILMSAGEYRECTLRYKGLLIASPPEHLAERMTKMVGLVNSGLAKGTDAHKLSWRAHHEFITLHPYIEGNGRMARLLMNFVRLRKGLDLSIVPFDNRDKYSRAIIEFQQQKIARDQVKAAERRGGTSGEHPIS